MISRQLFSIFSIFCLVFFLAQCGGGSSSTTSTTSSSITLTSSVNEPAAASTSISAAVSGLGKPTFAVAEAPVADGTECIIRNLTQARETSLLDADGVEQDLNVIAIVDTAGGAIDATIDTDDVADGDQLLIVVEGETGELTQIVTYDADALDGSTFAAPATDLTATLTFESLKTEWAKTCTALDFANLGAFNLTDSCFVEAAIDEECFIKYMGGMYGGADTTGSGGIESSTGAMKDMMAAAFVSGTFSTASTELFGGGFSDATIAALATGASTLSGVTPTSYESLYVDGANSVTGVATIAASVIAKENASTESCTEIKADTAGTVVQGLTNLMLAADDFAEVYNTYGTDEAFSTAFGVFETFKGGGSWEGLADFDPTAMHAIMAAGAGGGYSVADMQGIYNSTPAGMNKGFLDDFAGAMLNTIGDAGASWDSTNIDGYATHWILQIAGGGFVPPAEGVEFNYFVAADTFVTSAFTTDSGAFAGCASDPTLCADVFDSADFTIPGTSAEFYDATQVGTFVAPPTTETAGQCGNGSCSAEESASNTCPIDCFTPADAGSCGNHTCDAGELATTCPIDCGSGFPVP